MSFLLTRHRTKITITMAKQPKMYTPKNPSGNRPMHTTNEKHNRKKKSTIFVNTRAHNVQNIKLIYKIRIPANNWLKRENYPIMRFLLLPLGDRLFFECVCVCVIYFGKIVRNSWQSHLYAICSRTYRSRQIKRAKGSEIKTQTTKPCFDVRKHAILWTNACSTQSEQITLY